MVARTMNANLDHVVGGRREQAAKAVSQPTN
jgi:hypothetical protein